MERMRKLKQLLQVNEHAQKAAENQPRLHTAFASIKLNVKISQLHRLALQTAVVQGWSWWQREVTLIMAEGVPILLQKDNTFTKLFVGGLPYHTNDETLKAFFLQYGEIEEAVVIYDRNTGKSKGYGFVSQSC